ncbi:hypothetical protein P691DRAFT_817833 [Macrolepiota fuliginosa MF-IS2]|uniref:Uncharacterized protein n=1 Tax=Macrolepiota fuliginosa MF-IS2 TaxID=1400762 RepID=A0A9P5WZI6_9AGAR|nr:hypothetical protein P691DRAFT_817833 [Macrolepiota fuliginosa MF-IS2]
MPVASQTSPNDKVTPRPNDPPQCPASPNALPPPVTTPVPVASQASPNGHDADTPQPISSLPTVTRMVLAIMQVLPSSNRMNAPTSRTAQTQPTSSGTQTINTTTEVPTQISTTSLSNGPPKGIIGGVIGATIIIILALIVFCLLRRKQRKLVTLVPKSCAPAALISQLPQPLQITNTSDSVIPFPFKVPTPATQDNAVTVRQEGKEQIPPSPPKCNQENVGDNRDPFRDPEMLDGDASHQEVQGARNALDRLQQLTNQLEMELQQLSDLA